MRPQYTAYADVARLPIAALMRLLVGGCAQERVWAAWALGLRGEAPGRAALHRTFAHDPDDGVRRHVLIVLIGLGEHALLRRTVAHESSPWLRGTATGLLARQCEPDDAVAYDLLVARSLDLAWAVRYAIADALRADAPPAVVRAVAGLLFDPESIVRRRMQARVERGDFDRKPFAAALQVVRRAERHTVKPDREIPDCRALVCLRDPTRLL